MRVGTNGLIEEFFPLRLVAEFSFFFMYWWMDNFFFKWSVTQVFNSYLRYDAICVRNIDNIMEIRFKNV
jgi:hypothetical protein